MVPEWSWPAPLKVGPTTSDRMIVSITAPVGQGLGDSDVALLRARVSAGISLVVPAALVGFHLASTAVFPAAHHPLAGLVTGGLFTMAGLWFAVRGARVCEPEFVALVCLTMVAIAAYVAAVQTAGSATALEWAVLSGVINGAVFALDRRSVVVIAVVGFLSMAWVSWARLGLGGGAAPMFVVEFFQTGFVALAIRALREVAVAAIDRASRGEVTDPLTGVANRRGVDRQGGRIWRAAGSDRRPISLLVVDIDHFKQINDTFGHAEGDRVIRELATLLQDGLRESDLVARVGGEEFLMLLRAEPEEAVQVAERLRARVQEELAPVTISVGVAQDVPDPQEEPTPALWRAVARADEALYAAKHSGRNQVREAVPHPDQVVLTVRPHGAG